MTDQQYLDFDDLEPEGDGSQQYANSDDGYEEEDPDGHLMYLEEEDSALRGNDYSDDYLAEDERFDDTILEALDDFDEFMPEAKPDPKARARSSKRATKQPSRQKSNTAKSGHDRRVEDRRVEDRRVDKSIENRVGKDRRSLVNLLAKQASQATTGTQAAAFVAATIPLIAPAKLTPVVPQLIQLTTDAANDLYYSEKTYRSITQLPKVAEETVSALQRQLSDGQSLTRALVQRLFAARLRAVVGRNSPQSRRNQTLSDEGERTLQPKRPPRQRRRPKNRPRVEPEFELEDWDFWEDEYD